MADWENAAFHIKPIVRDLYERPWLTKSQKAHAKQLESRIKKVLGPKYDEVKTVRQLQAEEATMENLNLGKGNGNVGRNRKED